MPVADQWPLWKDLLRRYAVAQLAVGVHRGVLLATGAPERSPATLPDQGGDLIVELALAGTEQAGLSAAGAEALEARLPALGRWCRDLGGAGIPATIAHDDLHSNNVCRRWPGPGCGPAAGRTATHPAARSRIIDWGDASIGHPFGSLLATLRSIARHGGCQVNDPAVQRVRDAYLEPFTTCAPRCELVAALTMAGRVGVVEAL